MCDNSDDVSSNVWRDLILEAIHCIKLQKQRPSKERICQAIISSHHEFQEDVFAKKLQEAVQNGIILKVYNKGLLNIK